MPSNAKLARKAVAAKQKAEQKAERMAGAAERMDAGDDDPCRRSVEQLIEHIYEDPKKTTERLKAFIEVQFLKDAREIITNRFSKSLQPGLISALEETIDEYYKKNKVVYGKYQLNANNHSIYVNMIKDKVPIRLYGAQISHLVTHPDVYKRQYPERCQLKEIHNSRVKHLGHTFFYFNPKTKITEWGTNQNLTQNLIAWKKQKNEGIIIIDRDDNATIEIDGKLYFTLVIKQVVEPIPLDALLLNMGVEIAGIAAWFVSNANRDATIDYVMGKG